jgi:Spy/CpxP family protein refolding chaperone
MSPSNQIFARPNRLLLQATLALALLVVLCMPKTSVAQHRGGAPGGGGGFPGGMHTGEGGVHGGTMGGEFPRSSNIPRSSNAPTEMNRNNPARTHANLQVGPPGRWWDDKHFVKQLKLSEDQQRHMDAIFEQNRPMLLKRYEALEQEEQRMEALTHAKTLDETTLFAQIDRIEQARADLGKATLHCQVQLRNELDAGQIARLEDQQQ